jgi:Abnormal spindle-like microcephaly-assoc'd, ASPM-SPD-2-Hydin
MQLSVRRGVAVATALAALGVAAPANAAIVVGEEEISDATGLRLGIAAPEEPEPGDPVEPAEPGGVFWSATASIASGGVTADLTMAVETEPDEVDPADNVISSVISLRAEGLQAGAAYRVIHPYGVDTGTADGSGRLQLTMEELELGEGTNASRLGPLLRWAPAGGAAPAGTIGDPEIGHAVVGSPDGTNVFRIETAGGQLVGETNQFLVTGETIGAAPSPAFAEYADRAMSFPSTQVGQASSDSITVRSTGFSALQTSTSITGAAAGDYSVARSCPSIAPLSACELTVTFRPTAAGTRSARLNVADNAPDGDLSVATQPSRAVSLSGNATAAPAPAGAQSPGAGQPVVISDSLRRVAPRLTRLSVLSRLRLRSARRNGIRIGLRLANARTVRVSLLRSGRVVGSRRLAVRGSAVRLNSAAIRRRLRPGTYVVVVTPVGSNGALGQPLRRTLRIVR